MRQAEPHEERGCGQYPRLGGELRISRGVEIKQNEHAREDCRIGNVKGQLPHPEEEVQEEDRHHAPAVHGVVIHKRLPQVAPG